MNDSRWDCIQEVFEKVDGRPADEVTALLEAECRGDDVLRGEVLSLLESERSAPPSFLRPSAMAAGTDRNGYGDGGGDGDGRGGRGGRDGEEYDVDAGDAADPLIGRHLGPFKILEALDCGGMGTVYKAEQVKPRRIVALKAIRNLLAFSRSAVRRFDFESEVLARLTHPHIAQVYHAGTSAIGGITIPYFAMEYIPDARSITDYAAANRLGTRERLKLFLQICDGVHFGHQKGVIHRDLKPGNLLVDTDGQVRIIDFGVARSTDADVAVTTMHTGVGEIIGTLHYMSPEQCRGDPLAIDIRSDVYALGVVLYELLCGRLPYGVGGSPVPVAARTICEAAPDRPSTFHCRLPRDLEHIIFKALEKEPHLRYGSVSDLAQDIRRYLSGEPISARAPSAWTRAIRLITRYPVATTTGLCLAIAGMVIAGTFAAVWWLNLRPDRVVVADDGSSAQLLSVTGRTIHTWSVEPPGRINAAQLVERPEEMGGGNLVLLGYGPGRNHRWAGQLCAFDLDVSLDEPIWRTRLADADLPAMVHERGATPEWFGLQTLITLDVFSERPGVEIIVEFAYMYSQHPLRIHDLEGELLWQVWEDGGVGEFYWMKDAGLLVCNGRNAEVYAEERGYPKDVYPHPPVVFAVRPRLGFISNEFLRTEPADGPLDPAWYLTVLPRKHYRHVGKASLRSPQYGYDARRTVEVEVQIEGVPGANILWVIDENGQVVPDSRVVCDGYWRNLDKLPHPDEFHFGPLPAILDQREASPAASENEAFAGEEARRQKAGTEGH